MAGWSIALLVWLTALLAGSAEAQTQQPSMAAPPTPAARFEQAVQWAQSGRDADALAAFETLAREYPNRPEPRVNLAVLLARQGQVARARAELDAALRSSAGHAHAYDQLLTLHAHMARDAYARASLATAEPASSAIALTMAPHWTQDSKAPPAGATLIAASGSGSAPTAAATAADPVQSTSAAASASGEGTLLPWRTVLFVLAFLLLVTLGTGAAWAARKRQAAPNDNPPTQPAAVITADVAPEERLIEVYRLIGAARLPEALMAAEALAHDEPSFQLAQLVHGDLLLAHDGRLSDFGRPTPDSQLPPPGNADALRAEALKRLRALRDSPSAGTLPRQLVQLPTSVKHAVAVDASRSRLFVFENRDGRVVLRSSHYVALGSLGVGKREEGDQRTPLGVYHITSRLDGRQLGDFYGPGALPLNYPNEHDRRFGRTGANIWLHGSPSAQYARGPRSTNGCIVLANDDMRRLLRELQPRHTPVVIAQQIDWVQPGVLQTERQAAHSLIDTWRQARAQADMRRLGALYARHFDNGEAGMEGWLARLASELTRFGAREREIIDLTVLAWQEKGDHLIVDFTELAPGSGLGPQRRRQYWARESGQWKIFSEGVFE